MKRKTFALALPFAYFAAPASANVESFAEAPQPRALAAIQLGPQKVEMLAVTQRARADTPLRKAYVHECKAMDKVLPGYPQPAFVSVDFRVRF